MEASINRLETLYHAGSVKRAHTIPTLFNRTIAEHVYGAQCIARELCHLNGVDAGRVLIGILVHDAPEVHTGDLPANVKKASEPISHEFDKLEEEFHVVYGTGITLTEIEEQVLSASDNLDFMFTCLHERRMGNRHPYLTTVFRRSSSYVEKYFSLPGVAALAAHIKREWDNV